MFKVERIRRIKEILSECYQIDVATLSNLLGVSDATIRNDFEELEQEGFLTRFHGGATIHSIDEKENQDDLFGGVSVSFDKNKEQLGLIASKLIQEREWIFLGPGTTSYYIAKALLQRKNINVLTNNFGVASVLSSNVNIQVVFLGGKLIPHYSYSFPDDIETSFRNMYLDKCFFSVDGVDFDGGYTLSDWNIQEMIKTVSKKSKQLVFTIDSTKFGKRSFRKIGNLDFPDILITNGDMPAEFESYYTEHGVPVYTS